MTHHSEESRLLTLAPREGLSGCELVNTFQSSRSLIRTELRKDQRGNVARGQWALHQCSKLTLKVAGELNPVLAELVATQPHHSLEKHSGGVGTSR